LFSQQVKVVAGWWISLLNVNDECTVKSARFKLVRNTAKVKDKKPAIKHTRITAKMTNIQEDGYKKLEKSHCNYVLFFYRRRFYCTLS